MTEHDILTARYFAALNERTAAEHKLRPSRLWQPKLFQDGNAWIALYGEDIASGVVGTGDSPEAAMLDFDAAWVRTVEETRARLCKPEKDIVI